MMRIGLAIVLVAALAAALGPALTPFDPSAQSLAQRLEPPSQSHPFGLDELGRDILSRLLSGARISLFVGLTVVSVSSLLGMALGSIAGYFGGAVDDVISRGIDVLTAGPVHQRMAVFFLNLTDRFGDEREDGTHRIPFGLPRQLVASYVNARVETVIRTITSWRREGLLHMEREHVVIDRIDALRLLVA